MSEWVVKTGGSPEDKGRNPAQEAAHRFLHVPPTGAAPDFRAWAKTDAFLFRPKTEEELTFADSVRGDIINVLG